MSQTFPTYPAEPTNHTRALWARKALMAFAAETGQTADLEYLSDPERDRGWFLEVAGDLLADLFHLADAVGVAPEELVGRARYHHEAEVVEAEDA